MFLLSSRLLTSNVAAWVAEARWPERMGLMILLRYAPTPQAASKGGDQEGCLGQKKSLRVLNIWLHTTLYCGSASNVGSYQSSYMDSIWILYSKDGAVSNKIRLDSMSVQPL